MGGMTPGLQEGETRREAWTKLVELDPPADAALLQEATQPYEDWGIEPEVPRGAGWRAASRIWSPRYELIEPTAMEDIWDHGYVMTATIELSDRN